jgi:hypothetical protein
MEVEKERKIKRSGGYFDEEMENKKKLHRKEVDSVKQVEKKMKMRINGS